MTPAPEKQEAPRPSVRPRWNVCAANDGAPLDAAALALEPVRPSVAQTRAAFEAAIKRD